MRCSAGYCWVAYAVALATVGFLYPVLSDLRVLSESPVLLALSLDLAATVVVWLFSLAGDNSSVYDPYWCVAPLVLSLWLKEVFGGGLMPLEAWHPRQAILCVLLWAWAWRFHLLVPWHGWWRGLDSEDWRYELMRGRIRPSAAYWSFSLSSLHVTPTLLVFFAGMPAWTALATGPSGLAPLAPPDLLGAAAASAAILLEWRADEELRRFRQSQEYRDGGTCCTGLWALCRHPNYLGETAFWLALVPLALADAEGISALCWRAVGSVAMLLFFRFASLPLMDERSCQRRPGYARIMREIPALFPRDFFLFLPTMGARRRGGRWSRGSAAPREREIKGG